jgi:hypothetical protein
VFFVMLVSFVIALIAVIAISSMLRSRDSISSQTFAVIRGGLLWIAGIISGLMTLMISAAAAWGMDTRTPWGLGIYMYLIPALSLPAFLLLKFSVRALSRAMWSLTFINALAWVFGYQADRIASGLRPVMDAREITGMFLSGFTLLYFIIAVLVQLAEQCRSKDQTELASTQMVE